MAAALVEAVHFSFFFMMTMQIDKLNLSFMFVDPAFMQHFGLAGSQR